MYQGSIGAKRGHDSQSDELDVSQFLSAALLQQKLVRTEQELKTYADIFSAPLPNEIQVHPAVAAELQKTRKDHDMLVLENEKLKRLSQPSQYITDLTDSNKKLKAELSKLSSEQPQLHSKLQDYEQLVELLKQDAMESRKQIKELTETNASLSAQLYKLQSAQTTMQPTLVQPPAPPAEEKVDLTAFLLQATGEMEGEESTSSPKLDVEQFDGGYQHQHNYDGNEAASPVLEVDEDFYQ